MKNLVACETNVALLRSDVSASLRMTARTLRTNLTHTLHDDVFFVGVQGLGIEGHGVVTYGVGPYPRIAFVQFIQDVLGSLAGSEIHLHVESRAPRNRSFCNTWASEAEVGFGWIRSQESERPQQIDYKTGALSGKILEPPWPSTARQSV